MTKYTCSAAFWRRSNAPFERICRRLDGQAEIEIERREAVERRIQIALAPKPTFGNEAFRRLLDRMGGGL